MIDRYQPALSVLLFGAKRSFTTYKPGAIHKNGYLTRETNQFSDVTSGAHTMGPHGPAPKLSHHVMPLPGFAWWSSSPWCPKTVSPWTRFQFLVTGAPWNWGPSTAHWAVGDVGHVTAAVELEHSTVGCWKLVAALIFAEKWFVANCILLCGMVVHMVHYPLQRSSKCRGCRYN